MKINDLCTDLTSWPGQNEYYNCHCQKRKDVSVAISQFLKGKYRLRARTVPIEAGIEQTFYYIINVLIKKALRTQGKSSIRT